MSSADCCLGALCACWWLIKPICAMNSLLQCGQVGEVLGGVARWGCVASSVLSQPAFLHGLADCVVLIGGCPLADGDMPGSAILSSFFPGVRVDSTALQGDLQCHYQVPFACHSSLCLPSVFGRCSLDIQATSLQL